MPPIVEWRRQPLSDPHTGSVEAAGLPGKPFIYVHPQDRAAGRTRPRRSFEADWRYSLNDGAELTVAGAALHVALAGHTSYDRYLAIRAQYQAASRLDRLLWRLGAVLLGTPAPAQVYAGTTPATLLQPSGDLVYDAFLRLDPPDSGDGTVDIEVALEVSASMSLTANARGAGFVDASAIAFDGATEIARVGVQSGYGAPADHGQQTVAYAVTVPAGGEVRVARAVTGLAFNSRVGGAGFACDARVSITV
jgi:hypothetical protein